MYCSFLERYPAKLIIGKLIEHVFWVCFLVLLFTLKGLGEYCPQNSTVKGFTDCSEFDFGLKVNLD
jgi:hypothetical protein